MARHLLAWSAVAPVLLMCTGCRELGLTDPHATATLTPVWSAPLPGAAAAFWIGRPAVDGGRVFVQASNQLLGLDAERGTVLWSRAVRVAPVPPPTVLLARDGAVYLSEVDSVLAVDGATGQTRWAFHPDSQAVVAPALDESAVYTGQRGIPVAYALDRASGRLRWRTDLSSGRGYAFEANVSGLTVGGDTVYVAFTRGLTVNLGSSSGVLVALDRRDGRELWRYEASGGGNHSFPFAPVVAGRYAVVSDFQGQALVAYDVVAQRVGWRAPFSLASATSLTLTNGILYVGATDGYAYAFDAATGTLRWRTGRFSSALGATTCGGAFFVNDERIRRFEPASGRLTGESPPNDFASYTSDLATDGTRIYFTGFGRAFAMGCP